MTVCARCGAQYEEAVRFCPLDGQPLGEDYAPYVGKVLLGQFELLERIGAGAMGTVYRAWQNTMDRPVAVKVLRRELLRDPAVVKRFYREARAVARLSHPNIITVFLVGECDDGAPYIVMEMVEGTSLAQLLEAEGALETGRAVRIATQIAGALCEAHAAQVVHRDLKPENILLSPRRRQLDFVKVLDFGIAKILAGSHESHLTSTGALFGTPHYIAPEQAAGSGVDHRADLYSLGVILYRMVTGRLPFDGESGMSVVLKHLHEIPPAPGQVAPGVPRELEAVIVRAMAKDPAERFQTADEMSLALAALDAPAVPRRTVAGLSVAMAEPPSRVRLRRVAARPLFWAPALAVLGAASAIGYLYLSSGTRAESKPEPQVIAQGDPVSPPAPPPAAQTPRSLRLSEEGYAFEVAPPADARTGANLSFVVDAEDPEGQPLRGARLELGIRGPDKNAVEQTVPMKERAPGRYVAAATLAKSGGHHVHLYAQTRRGEKLKVWFDLSVSPGVAPAPLASVHKEHHGRGHAGEDEMLPGPPPAPEAVDAQVAIVVPVADAAVPASEPAQDPQPDPVADTQPPAQQPTEVQQPQPPPQTYPAPIVRPPAPLRPPRYGPRYPYRWRRLPAPPVSPPQ